MDVRVEGGSVAALDLVAGVSLPELQVLLTVEVADLAQVVGVALAGEHGVGGELGGLVFLQC